MLTLTYPEGSVLVAGGSGSVGSGAVTRLAEAGLPVTFTYRGNERAAHKLEKSSTEQGHRVQAVRMTAEDPASVAGALTAAEEFGGPLRTFAWAVGSRVPFNKLADFTIEEVVDFVNGDALACYRVLHQVVPALRRNGGGSITAATTIATQRVVAYDGISPFAKGAVQALLRQLAAEEAEHGIRVNDIAIGMIFDMPIEELEQLTLAGDGIDSKRMSAMLTQLRSQKRLGSSGRPGDAGNLFAFLASDQASFLTGQRIAIDGGMTL